MSKFCVFEDEESKDISVYRDKGTLPFSTAELYHTYAAGFKHGAAVLPMDQYIHGDAGSCAYAQGYQDGTVARETALTAYSKVCGSVPTWVQMREK